MGCAVLLCFAIVSCSTLCGIAVPIHAPFQVVQPTANHSSMVPVAEGLAKLSEHDQKIAVVSVVGPYHSGKSFLLNSLMGSPMAFKIGPKTSPETMGLWLCRTNMTAADGSEVWLMDSEGFFGPGIDESYDAKVFTIATLLGAHLVYNTVKIIDQQAVSLLEMLARRAQLFRTRTSAEDPGTDTPEFLSSKSFPPLTWVVEDFVQEIPEVHWRERDAATSWLKSYLSKVNASNLAGGAAEDEMTSTLPTSTAGDYLLGRLYSDIKVHTLFLPATSKDQLQDLSKVGWEQLTPEFRREVEVLRKHITTRLTARRFEQGPMTGRTLARALGFIVQALQRGMFHDLPSLWSTWTKQVSEISLQDADHWFASLLTAIDNGEDPVPVAVLNTGIADAREKTVKFYKELLRNFDVVPNVGELRNRMAVHFNHKLLYYHERVQRWVGNEIEVEKDNFLQFLNALTVPMDPDALRKQCEASISIRVKGFASKLTDFGQQGSAGKFGRSAHMPSFTQDPSAQLHSDLRASQASREIENEREIMQLFKAAVNAADEAVEAELKANAHALMGKSRLKELRTLVESRCWQAFDEPLQLHGWVKTGHHYKMHKAMVQTETLDGRMARFTAANDQRVAAHFRTTLERVVSSYSTRKATLSMPVSDEDLSSEHAALASQMRSMIQDQGKELHDTDMYKATLRELTSVMEEGLHYLKQKNIELWKVHSDEATRCARHLNSALARECGLTCLFNKVPMRHKAKSREHLLGCFGTSKAASRMSPKMQQQVFEDWYSKDLGHDATVVQNHFYIMSLVIGFISLAIALCWCRQRPPPINPYFTTMNQPPNPYQQTAPVNQRYPGLYSATGYQSPNYNTHMKWN
mmetsp:Transcript_64893/g.120751  ORF Transcript_64893/g.120751 Transcript_64893/m.120751 type:complete len:863 (-) Transcript_64893:164-2752(-)